MSTPVPYLIQGKNIILVIDGKSHTVSKTTHISYHKIVDALKDQDWDALRELVEPKTAIASFGKGFISVENNEVMWKGKPFHNALSTRMIEMFQEGLPIDSMVYFMENLMQNPSKRSVDQVYGFLDKNKLPITPDGCFLAYKKVRKDYLDIHSGTIFNGVGTTVEMDRCFVDDNPESHCSFGLHFCSESYLGSFGSSDQPVMILKINPADVVSIPTDYNGAKGRCCKYIVVAEVQGDPALAFASIVNSDYSTPVAPVPTPAKAAPAPKAAPAAKAAPAPSVTAAMWPFPVPPEPAVATPAKAVPAKKVTGYTVERVRDRAAVAYNLSLTDARDLVDKNARQKKSKLQIVDQSGTIVS